MPAETLRGTVERITFYNAENGYTVLRLRPSRLLRGMGRDGLVTVVGELPELSPGEHLELTGRWATHSRYGRQFVAETCRQTLPATAEGIRRYLGSGLVRGIGPKLAARLVAAFGERTLDVLDREPERLLTVPGIGPTRMARLRSSWEEQKHIRRLMLFLHEHGVSTGLAVKIYKTYGAQALEVVRNDPYRLAQDIRGVGFKTADKVARALGLTEDHPSRLRAALVFVLEQAAGDGHTFLPREMLLAQAEDLLGQPRTALEEALAGLEEEGRVVLEQVPLPQARLADGGVREPAAAYAVPGVYLPAFHTVETGIAERLRALLAAPSGLPRRALPALTGHLSPRQAEAVQMALRSPVSVLTGGPGTGKTTTMRALIGVLEAWGVRYALAAPTGRAAQRLSEATRREASTLHRLLGYQPGKGFRYHPRQPLPVQFLVVDEASMLDAVLAYHTFGALAPGSHLLLVGDVDQLPSVGAGDVLREILAHPAVPAVHLDEIFRQAAGSLIITNAHRINRGEMPLFPKQDDADCFLFPAATPEQAADWVVDVVTRRIPRRFGLRAPHQIQVLAPMYRGPVGVHALNARLQAVLNPSAADKAERALFGQVFRVGDWVMQTRNDYNHEVFNGDLGTLVALDGARQTLTVDFGGRRVVYDWSEADQLVLAYAISVHKGQGAEFPAVVVPLVTQHYMMLQRNLLYTAVTRAQRLCVLVGQKRAIALAVKNDHARQRYTALRHFLQGRGKGD